MDRSEGLFGARAGEVGAQHAWRLTRKELLTEFGEAVFRSYFERLAFLVEHDGTLLFEADTGTAQDRIRMLYQGRLEARMCAHLGRRVDTRILVEREVPEDVRALIAERAAEAGELDVSTEGASAPQHNSQSFDTFCVDPGNFRAHSVARLIAQGTTTALFPTWLLHSAPGLGKTHLLNAIAHYAAEHTPDRKVLLLSGQEFLESFQSALHKKRDSEGFKTMVRTPDLLLIDDFHRIAGKRATEEEALDTIENLMGRGRQVVLAADHGVEGIAGLDERLRNKLRGAAACEIFEPTRECARRILDERVKHYARITQGFSVAGAALDMIAEQMSASGRELDGAVRQLLIEYKISGGAEVSVDAAMSALQGKLSEASERRITVQTVQKVVARFYGMTVQQLLERTRRHAIARPRQVAMHLASRLTHASLPDIGKRFGGFDHTTIMYARDKITELMGEDAKLRGEVDALTRLIRREPGA